MSVFIENIFFIEKMNKLEYNVYSYRRNIMIVLTEDEIIFRSKTLLEKIRPYIKKDGGDVEYVDYKDGIVYVRMLGACIGCDSLDITMKDGIEALLLEEVPGVIGVEVAPEPNENESNDSENKEQ